VSSFQVTLTVEQNQWLLEGFETALKNVKKAQGIASKAGLRVPELDSTVAELEHSIQHTRFAVQAGHRTQDVLSLEVVRTLVAAMELSAVHDEYEANKLEGDAVPHVLIQAFLDRAKKKRDTFPGPAFQMVGMGKTLSEWGYAG
jgi:hypothetical protein